MAAESFNRHAFPAGGGWTFRQPQTRWTNPYAMVGFDASVKEIIKHRKANPAITAKHKLSTDYTEVGNELEKYTRARLGIPQPQPTFFRSANSRLPGHVTAVAANVRRAAQGTAVVLDWLTSGGRPVEQEIANARAAICVPCVHNVEGSWYTIAPAELIRATLSARSELKLETPYDDKLKSCDICKCLNRLKPWVPIHHIKDHTKPEIMAEFPEWCWIKKELKSEQSS